MSRFDWVFVTVFYFGGMVLLAMGIDIMERFAGAGLFGAVSGLVMIGTATYHINLEEYR